MSIITSIKPQKNNKRVNIFLDDKFGFGLDLENYVVLNLKIGQELTDSEISEILKKDELTKTTNKLLRFATLRPRSRYEVNNWLRKHKVHQSLHKKLFSKLKRLELLGDKKFATWWVDQRNQFKPRGARALYSELLQKGIDKNIINQTLEEANINEVSIAKKLIQKNNYKWQRFDGDKKKQKIIAFLSRKGFNWEIIKKVC